MSDTLSPRDHAIHTLPLAEWHSGQTTSQSVVKTLEQGKVLFLPQLAFSLSEEEKILLDPVWVEQKRKNISYLPESDKLSGVAKAEKEPAIRQLLQRHHTACCQLISHILPEYQDTLRSPTNSLRLHPVTRWTQQTSWRKDDSRLHVDAFPSRPNYGERILRIFTNINPDNQPRSWRVGEPFPELAAQFLPRLRPYSPTISWLQNKLGITKRYRSHYDHLMLQMHDAMKADSHYQQQGKQVSIDFPAGSSWICFSDQTPHAAMSGQFMLEQTFLLPVSGMQDPQQSPLKVLESAMKRTLI